MHKFGSVAAKIRFFQRVNNKELPWNSGEGMWLSSNKTFRKRLLDKTLGQIRPQLIESKGFCKTDIKIKRPQKIMR